MAVHIPLRPRLGIFLTSTLTIWILARVLTLEEFAQGEKVEWFCAQCKYALDGFYSRDTDLHPICDGTVLRRRHAPMKMTPRAR